MVEELTEWPHSDAGSTSERKSSEHSVDHLGPLSKGELMNASHMSFEYPLPPRLLQMFPSAS